MNYTRALTRRRRALLRCRAARADMDSAVDALIGAYRAHPLPILAGAAVLGFALGRLRVGGRFIRVAMRVASGPAWGLVRQFVGNA